MQINHHVNRPGVKNCVGHVVPLTQLHICCVSQFVCVQEAQIARQRRTVVPSVPQNAEWEARSLFAKEVL